MQVLASGQTMPSVMAATYADSDHHGQASLERRKILFGSERKKEDVETKRGMGGRHAATTQGFGCAAPPPDYFLRSAAEALALPGAPFSLY